MNGLRARLVMAVGAIPDDWRPVVDYFFTDDQLTRRLRRRL